MVHSSSDVFERMSVRAAVPALPAPIGVSTVPDSCAAVQDPALAGSVAVGSAAASVDGLADASGSGEGDSLDSGAAAAEVVASAGGVDSGAVEAEDPHPASKAIVLRAVMTAADLDDVRVWIPMDSP